ncbi:MAG: PAS domain S-box protein, partial [Nitrospinota bacterium]|nr:PAS domain S-box protein [Nitrospinota bacterium]
DRPLTLFYFTGLMISMYATSGIFHLPYRATLANTLLALPIYLVLPLAHHLPAPIVIGHLAYMAGFSTFAIFSVWLYETSLRQKFLSELNLKAQEEKFRAYIENASDAVTILDRNAVVTYASPAIERLSGFTPDTVVGANAVAHVLDEDLQNSQRRLAEAMANPGVCVTFRHRAMSKDGAIRHYEVAAINHLDNPAINGIMCSCRDVTSLALAEAELEKTRAQFKAYLENIESAVCVYDRQARFIYASPVVEKLTGYTLQELIGASQLDYLHPDDRKTVAARLGSLLEAPSAPVSVVTRMRKKDGGYFYLEAVGRNMLADPQIQGLMVAYNDVTARVEAEQKLKRSEERFRAIMAHSHSFVMITNRKPDGGGVFVSEGIKNVLGYTPEEFTCLRPAQIIHPEDIETSFRNLDEALKNPGQPITGRIRFLAKDGQYRTMYAIGVNYMDNPFIGGVLINWLDVSQLKAAEDALMAAKEQAEQATLLKDKFVSLVSHDLRSPLGSAKGLVGLLAKAEEYNLTSEKRREIIGKADRTLEGMLELIDQILDIGRISTGKIRPVKRPLDLHQLVATRAEELDHMAAQKGVLIENKIPPGARLAADEALFGEVIRNLLSNALKFTNKGDTITIFMPDNAPHTVAVRDTGVGIDQKLIPDLFNPDVKTSTPGTAGEKGTGLGLPYCMEIIKAHGGAIKVESEKGSGTVFHVQLPASEALILLVDDHEAQRSVAKSMLSKFIKVDIIEADNGKEALKMAAQMSPNLIITDIQMPLMDGFAFIDSLKKNPYLSAIPVIVITSSESSPDQNIIDARSRVLQMGASDFAIKPLHAADFVPRVRRLIDGAAIQA